MSLQTTACIIGGGPAGLMAGLLLARNGVDVIVLSKHAATRRSRKFNRACATFAATHPPVD